MSDVDEVDETHDPARRSFVESANDPDTEFPIQNLPLGIFSTSRDPVPRIGVAIGDQIFDLKRARSLELLPSSLPSFVFEQTTLNALFGQGRSTLRRLRRCVADLLDRETSADITKRRAADLFAPIDQCTMYRPTDVGNYTDFYAGIYHARAAGALLTPENPLPQNYKWIPIAYHGRASSVQVGRGAIKRPLGQRPPSEPGRAPEFGPCERLDFELEMGFYHSGGNGIGHPIPIGEAGREILGFSLLNDWSARDIQRWEMFPLGPFLSKSFATFVSPWVVTSDALIPFRVAAMERPDGDPRPLGYLLDEADQAAGGIDVDLEVYLSTEQMRSGAAPAVRILTSNARYLYWTPAQMIAHHTVNGCNLEAGDLIGTGTISGPSPQELSSMLELTAAGAKPVGLPNCERRSFLQDGDEITFKGRCSRGGFASVGFGSCTGRISGAAPIVTKEAV
ncbi:fumarylacetoacetase [Bradyrhizobium sp. Ai1a-2]|uniref:fumarylacetoacetase n=1 Tax=Bradyrhizobium sp. Ai1a-2 TaxID=196490 RepID=UPI0004181D8C|nr:fumarylacetoacetase [Bradyrhizobium sp. Ai1a-2]